MSKVNESEPTSGFIKPEDFVNSNEFTEFTSIPNNGYCQLIRAKRQGRWWMLKGLKEQFRQDTIYRALIQKEYEITCQLQHPMVVSVFSLEEVEGLGLCIVTEWIDGVTLKEWLLENGHTRRQRRHVADMLMEALEYVHSQQTEHRDLKPSNVMITNDGHYLKLIDFGLSDTKSYVILKGDAGTEGYMAPDGPSDIYSLGVILRELRLGFFSHFAIRRCLAPRERRISHVTDVRNALHRSWLWPRRIVAILLAVLLLSAFYGLGLSYSSKRLHPEIAGVQTVLTDSINRTQTILTDSINRLQTANHAVTDSLQHHIMELETEKQAAEALVRQREEIIHTIQRGIDQKVRASGIEQLLDTVSSQLILGTLGITTSQEILTYSDTEAERLSKQLSKSDQAVIKSTLQDYILSRYAKRWEKRRTELPLY